MVNVIPKDVWVDASLQLQVINESHARPLLKLLNNNRNHLREWLPWVDGMKTEDDFLSYVSYCQRQHAAGTDAGYVIMLKSVAVGRIGLHYINSQNKSGAIGYWLGKEFSGRGIITKACRKLLEEGFGAFGLNRIEIKCGTGNAKSAAVAKRLGFQQEGVLRQAEWVNNRFLDLEVYSMLQEEWEGGNMQ